MPALRWFQSQREGLGNESMTHSFISIAHKVGKSMLEDGLALTAPIAVKNAVSWLCCVRARSPGNLIPNPKPRPHRSTYAYPALNH